MRLLWGEPGNEAIVGRGRNRGKASNTNVQYCISNGGFKYWFMSSLTCVTIGIWHTEG